MQKIIRSLIWSDPATREDVTQNFSTVKVRTLTNMRTEEESLIRFCVDYFLRNGEAPSFRLTYDHFVSTNKAEELIFLDSIENDTPYIGSDFKETFVKEIEDQATAKMTRELREASDIARKQGSRPALDFLYGTVRAAPKLDESKIPVNMRGAKDALMELYEERENSSHQSGMKVGYDFFDSRTGGIAKGQLHILAGFNGHMKSTLMLNIIINSAVDHGWNNLLFTTEMGAGDIELMMAAIHSGHRMFQAKYGLERVPAFDVLRGRLTPKQKDILSEAMDDLTTNTRYGTIRVVDNSDFNGFHDILARTRQEHMIEPVDILWVDYLTRLPPEPTHLKSGMNAIGSRNEMILEAKRFAMQFDDGKGIAFCTPFQVNREGFKEAEKNGGKLNLAHLFQYNNAEKEADTVTYIWYGTDERLLNEPKIGFLKNRFGPCPFDPETVRVDEDTRRIFEVSINQAGTVNHPLTGQHVGSPGASDSDPDTDIELPED